MNFLSARDRKKLSIKEKNLKNKLQCPSQILTAPEIFEIQQELLAIQKYRLMGAKLGLETCENKEPSIKSLQTEQSNQKRQNINQLG